MIKNSNYLREISKFKNFDSKDYSLSNNNIADDFKFFLKKISHLKLLELISTYPEFKYEKLNKKIQKNFKIKKFIFGSGSEDLIIRINICLNKNQPIGILTPTFYRIIETIPEYKIRKIKIPFNLNTEYLSTEKIEEKISRIRSVWVTNPNPVNGKMFKKNDLIKLIKKYPKVLFIIDESSIDFIKNSNKHSLLGLSQRAGNLIIIRSFSKLYGLAGLRVGFASGKNKVLRDAQKIGTTFPINKVAEHILTIALEERSKYEAIRKKIKKNKNVIEKILLNNKDVVLNKSVTNCVFFAHKKKNTFTELLKIGILGLNLNQQEDIEIRNFVRLTVHSSAYLQKKLINKINKILK